MHIAGCRYNHWPQTCGFLFIREVYSIGISAPFISTTDVWEPAQRHLLTCFSLSLNISITFFFRNVLSFHVDFKAKKLLLCVLKLLLQLFTFSGFNMIWNGYNLPIVSSPYIVWLCKWYPWEDCFWFPPHAWMIGGHEVNNLSNCVYGQELHPGCQQSRPACCHVCLWLIQRSGRTEKHANHMSSCPPFYPSRWKISDYINAPI